MIKMIVTADWHLKLNESLGIKVVDGLNDRFLDKIRIASGIVQKAIESDVDYFFILGDLFDRPNPSEFLRKSFFDVIRPLFDEDIPVFLVSGNHGNSDFTSYNLMSESALCNFMNGFKFFNVIYDLDTLRFESNNDEGFTEISFFPDVNEDKIKEFIDKDKRGQFAFGHLNIRGADYGKRKSDSGIPLSIFDKYRFSLFGDIHKPQDNPNYVGSPWANKIDEFDYRHSVMLLGIPTEEGEQGNFERIELDETMQVLRFKIELPEEYETAKSYLLAQRINALRDLLLDDEKIVAYIKVVGKRNDLSLVTFDFGRLKKELIDYGYYDVRINYKLQETRVDEKDNNAFENKENIIDGAFDNYCIKNKLTKDFIDVGKKVMEIAGETN